MEGTTGRPYLENRQVAEDSAQRLSTYSKFRSIRFDFWRSYLSARFPLSSFLFLYRVAPCAVDGSRDTKRVGDLHDARS